MSFAMDDLGMFPARDSAFKTKPNVETGKVETSKTRKNSEKENANAEPDKALEILPAHIDDKYERSIREFKSEQKFLDSIQQQSSFIDAEKAALENMQASVKKIRSAVEAEEGSDEIKKTIDESVEKIQKNKQKQILRENELAEKLDELRAKRAEIAAPEKKEEVIAKLDDIINNITVAYAEKRQEQLVLTQRANSLVELKIAQKKPPLPKVEHVEKEAKAEAETPKSAEEVKEKAVESIRKQPEKSIQIQIKHIDKDMLLALMSLKMAG